MPTHDSYLRLTPLERLLPGEDFATRHFGEIRSEAEERMISLMEPGAFAMLDAVGRAVDDLRRTEDGADQRHQHALLLFHAFHMLDSEQPTHELVSTGVARMLVEAGSEGATGDGFLAASGASSRYIQLPQHLFWVRENPEDRPVSLDGFFCTADGTTVTILGVMGVTGPGQGFSILALPPLPVADAPIWLSEAMRPDGEDFRSTMPGAELEGLYELTNAGEVLKLVARLDRFRARFPEAGRRLEPQSADSEEGPGVPLPSGFTATLLTLD